MESETPGRGLGVLGAYAGGDAHLVEKGVDVLLAHRSQEVVLGRRFRRLGAVSGAVSGLSVKSTSVSCARASAPMAVVSVAVRVSDGRGAAINSPTQQAVEEALSAAGFQVIGLHTWDVPCKLMDMFLYAGNDRPELYFNARFRSGLSNFRPSRCRPSALRPIRCAPMRSGSAAPCAGSGPWHCRARVRRSTRWWSPPPHAGYWKRSERERRPKTKAPRIKDRVSYPQRAV